MRIIAVVKTERMSIYLFIFLIVLGVISFTHQPVRIAPPRRPPRRRSTCKGSYLQPGGEREWKVERENISALSAIFFHK